MFGFGPEAYGLPREGDGSVSRVITFPGVEPGPTETTERRSYEQDLALFQGLLERQEETLWEQSQAAALMEAKYGRETARMIASDTGLSASYVRMLTATYKAFPTPEIRAADLSFSHHRIAARTEDPQKWIELAVSGDMSCEDLRREINQAKDKMNEFAKAEKAEERIMRLVRQYNAQFAELTGKVAAVLWNDVATEKQRAG